MRVKLLLEYDGSSFSGWQLQPDAPSVQGTLERALATVLREPVRVVAAGRTDAGVHARGQVAAFSTTRPIDPATLQHSLNALAGPSIAVLRVEEAPAAFDPRREARARAYAYYLINRPAPSPLWRARAWHVRRALDAGAMGAAAARLVGEHDFSSFRGPECSAPHAVRRVVRSAVRRDGELIVYEAEANGFLRHMVRNIVGTLVQVGLGERSLEEFEALFAARDRRRAAPAAPAHGLYLVAVRYAG
jgi:tRNA pseudouridine38-40 synthase